MTVTDLLLSTRARSLTSTVQKYSVSRENVLVHPARTSDFSGRSYEAGIHEWAVKRAIRQAVAVAGRRMPQRASAAGRDPRVKK